MSSLHGPVVVAHRVQVVKVVLWVPAHPVRPSPWRPVRREAPAALASLHHVWCHVHTDERELHHVLNLHSSISILEVETSDMTKFHDGQLPARPSRRHYLSEALQVQYEDVRQGPQTELDAALLKLLTVRTAPGIIRSKLEPLMAKMTRD